MKRIACYVAATCFCLALAAPARAHWSDSPGTSPVTSPGADPQPDPQRQRPTVVDTPDGQRVTVMLSDPSRPASLEMNIVMGSITVKGVNRKDVLIEAHGTAAVAASRRRVNEEPPPAGLRRLTQGGPFTVEEDKNTVSIDADSPMRGLDFVIEVPLKTNLDIETVQGAVSVEGVDGELEIDSVNGAVNLASVGGCVVAHSVNGKLMATVTRINPGQPMAFTSMNGTVDVTLPAAVKANLKLRSDQGDVYSDFDLKTDSDKRKTIDHAIYGAVNGGGPDFEIRTFNGNVYVRKAR